MTATDPPIRTRRRRWGKYARRLLWVVLLSAIAFVIAFQYATRPAVLRERVAALFAQLNLDVTQINEIELSPFGGLQVYDLEVRARADSPLALPREPDLPPLLRMRHASIQVDPWALLWGSFEPQSILLDTPRIALLRPPEQRAPQVEQWDFDQLQDAQAAPQRLPALRIRNADVRVYAMRDGVLRPLQHWVIDAVGLPTPAQGDRSAGYDLRLRQIGGPRASRRGGDAPPLAQVVWRPEELIARIGWVDLAVAQTLLPTGVQDWIQRHDLTGSLRASEVVLRPLGVTRAEFELDDVRLHVPIEAQPTPNPYLYFEDLGGSLTYVRTDFAPATSPAQPRDPLPRGTINATLRGRCRAAPLELQLRAADVRLLAPAAAPHAPLSQRLRTGPYEINLSIDGVHVPTREDHPAFVTSENLYSPLRSWIRIYDAKGPLKLTATVSGDALPGATGPRYTGTLQPLGARLRMENFPYIIAGTTGTVRFNNDGIVLEALSGQHGGGRIVGSGEVENTERWTGFDLRFVGTNIASDQALYEALPPRYQQLWETANPVGLWDTEVLVRRPHGSAETGPLPIEVEVDAFLHAGRLTLRDNILLEHATGRVTIADDRLRLRDMQGFIDGAPVLVRGEVVLGRQANDPPAYDIQFQVADAALVRASPVSDAAGNQIGRVSFRGTGDVWGHVYSTPAAAQPLESYVVRVNDGALSAFGTPAYWRNLHGWVVLHAGAPRIMPLAGESAGGWIGFSGALPAALGARRPIRLHVYANDDDMARLLKQLVPGRWARIREALNIHGAGRLWAHFEPNVDSAGRDEQVARIRIEADEMQAAPLPLALENVVADVVLKPDVFELQRLRARYGAAGEIEVSGNGSWEGASPWTRIKATGWNIDLTPKFIDAMPADLATLLRRLAPTGRLETHLDELSLSGDNTQDWSATGRVLLRDASVQLGLALTDFEGTLWGSVWSTPENAAAVDAAFAIDRGLIAGRALSRCEGRLERPQGSDEINLEDIRSSLCEGEAQGRVSINLAEQRYETTFTFHDLDLSQAFPSRDPNRPTRAGRLDGRVFVRGNLNDPTARRGGGELRIRAASLLSSPVTAKVAEATPAGAQRDPFVDQALLEFVWESDTLRFNKVDIRASGLRLVGTGSWNTRTNAIDLTLLGAFGENTPRIFALTDLIEQAGQELTQYRVEGTVAKPRVTVEPLHNLTGPLRNLLGGED